MNLNEKPSVRLCSHAEPSTDNGLDNHPKQIEANMEPD